MTRRSFQEMMLMAQTPRQRPLISVLIPTRGRLELLTASVHSLVERASDATDLEFIIRTDRDDPTYTRENLRTLHPGWHQVIGTPLGYRGLHTYYNECARESRGDWLVIWNDDCVMRTDGWDEELRSRSTWLDPRTPWMILAHGHFPVVSAAWFRAAERLSASPHADSFLTEVAGIVQKEHPTAILTPKKDGADLWDIHHRADELADAGSERRKNEVLGPEGTSAMFFKPEMRAEIERDAKAISEAYRRMQAST